MKYLPLVVLFTISSFAQKITYKIPEDATRIVFLGNSITYAGQYVSYIDAYYTLKYPQRKLEFINLGLPSETVSKLSEPNHADGRFKRPKLQDRLKRVLKKAKPDLVFACYGMNDGIYLPFDVERFKKFKGGVEWLDKSLKKKKIPAIYITPTIYDDENGAAYANVMDLYSDWLLSTMYALDWNILDIHNPLKQRVATIRENNPYFKFAIDGVHPEKEGHWMIANQILISMGEIDRLYNSSKEFFDTFKNGNKILQLIERKQVIQKDAWLTEIGHKRPNMKIGMPMDKAATAIKVLNAEVETILEE